MGDRAIAWGTLESPYGTLVVAASEKGLLRVTMPGEEPDVALEEIAVLAADASEEPVLVAEPIRQLEAYFEQQLTEFTLEIDWALAGSGFGAEVLKACAEIPYGETRTYSQVAEAAGKPNAQRAAGTALGGNPLAPVVPCHRVILASGKLGNYGGGELLKRELLHMEGALGPRALVEIEQPTPAGGADSSPGADQARAA